jgi:PAS domain S-box-containing protein
MFRLKVRASFTTRLLVGSLIALLLLSIPVAIATHWFLKQNAIQNAGSQAQIQTGQIAQSIDRHLKQHLKDLVFAAELEQQVGGDSLSNLTPLIQLLEKNCPGYLWIGVTDTEGRVIAANDDLLVGKSVANRPWFQEGMKAPAIMDLHEAKLLATLLPERADEPYQFIDFTTPIRNRNGQTIGVIGIHLDWKYFIEQTEHEILTKTRPNLSTLILSNDGSLRLGNRLDMADLQGDTNWSAMAGFQAAQRGQSSWAVHTLKDQKQHLIAFSPNNTTEQTKSLGWVSVTIQPLDTVYEPVSMALWGAIAALLVGTGATLLLVLGLARSLSNQATTYLAQIRNQSTDANRLSIDELPSELQPTFKEILNITQTLSEQSARLEAALNTATESYWMVEALIVQAPIPIAMFDNDMNYIAASARWAKSFGTTKGESLIGKNYYELLPNTPPHWREAQQKGLKGESVSAEADHWTTPTGESVWLDWALEPWLRPDGQIGGIIIMSKDVSSERLVRAELAKSEERFQLAMEGSHDGLWDLDLVDKTTYYSPSWKRLLGYQDHELPNEFATWEKLTAPDDRELAAQQLTQALADPKAKSFQAEFRMAHKAGHWVFIQSKALIVRDAQGNATRIVGTHLDRTVQLELENRLRDASITAKAEKESNAEKSRFLATLSHEIRTPLNGITGFASLLEMDLPPGEQKEQAGLLVQSAQTLSTILNDILDFSKMESGMVQLNYAPFMMEQLISSSAELTRLTAKAKGLTFEIDNQISGQQVYSGDMVRLRQILQNLLNNAVKFTTQGQVTLAVSNTPIGKQRDILTFSVNDTGVGIHKAQQHQLFKPFVQLHKDRDNRYGGTGLGLSIVKSLVKAMHGEIQVSSEPGQGTHVVFSVTLNKEAAISRQNDVRIKPSRPLKVLVADDTPLNIKLVNKFLAKDHHTTVVATDGQEALDKAMSEPFDFILLDIDMPKLNGYEVAMAIRQQEGPNQYCEIAALTGYAFDSDVKKSQESGINYHFAKPVQFDLLLNRLAMSSQVTL